MSRTVQTCLLAGLLLVLLAGFATLYRLRVTRGDVYPLYSSLRADPLGLRALHDSLAELPGVQVARHHEPLGRLPSAPRRTIVVAGLTLPAWRSLGGEEALALDRAAREGSRVVLTLRPLSGVVEEVENETRTADAKKRADEVIRKRQEEAAPEPRPDDAERKAAIERLRRSRPDQLWGVRVVEPREEGTFLGARRGVLAPASLPFALRWDGRMHLAFEPGVEWRVLYRRANEPVLAERTLGLGSLVIATDSYLLSNESLQQSREPALLSWVVGPHAQVEFEEGHFGILRHTGVAALARRYGLTGAAATLGLLAALFAWRRMVLFVPPAPEQPDLILTHSPTAGLEALLRRAVAPGELIATCVREWRRTARPSDLARVEAATAGEAGPGGSAAYNRAVRALRRR